MVSVETSFFYHYTYVKNKIIVLFMLEVFITKLMLFILVMSICNVIREIWTLYRCYVLTEMYDVSSSRLIWFWVSLSYIIMTIITGL